MSCSFCGKDQVIAKGLCRSCYYRLRKNGSLEYRRWHKPKRLCSVDGCLKAHVAKGFCEKHYKSVHRTGEVISLFGYGDRQSHPLYESWLWQKRTKEGRVKEWDDFWNFVATVPEKPTGKFKARRADFNEPWGPNNFYWHEQQEKADSAKEAARIWRNKNPLSAKSHGLKKSYGITITDYVTMYDEQGGKCAICGDHGESFAGKEGRSKTLVVDHCHESGKVRALLCNKCNKAIGLMKESPSLFRKAEKYIRRHKGG